jgi:substrate import-associated zinc metallohydrolase lipoprotein
MKHTYIFLFGLLALLASACSNDDLDKESIFTETTQTESTPLDQWVKTNFTDPYNIRFLYRYNDKETNNYYNVIPADYDKSVALAILLKHVWIDTYTELVGQDFMKTYCPRIYQLIGSAEYNSSTGSIVLGTAEGGVKVTLFRVNDIDVDHPVIDSDSPYPNTEAVPIDLNYWFFHTMHHEFCHILTQKKDYSTDFRTISTANYQRASWINVKDKDAGVKGFVTGYASMEYNEDFAETYATYITHTEDAWNQLLENSIQVKLDENEDTIFTYDKNGNKYPVYDYSGYEAIIKKLNIVKDYFQKQWGIDIDKLRTIVLRRSQEVKDLDLHTLK